MFFVHPQHGAMNASESEAAELEKQGWKASTREEWFRMNGKGHPLQQEVELPPFREGSVQVLNELATLMGGPGKRRPGRPSKESA
jgi:hypothetical protein